MMGFVIHKDDADPTLWKWTLLADNGVPIAVSACTFNRKDNARRSAHAFQKHADLSSAVVVDED